MEWFKEGVVNAISQCRQRRVLLVVYLKDTTEATSQTNQSWNSKEVLDLLGKEDYVAIELMKDTTEFQQFSQLFPVLLTPSVFCISPTGDQLAVASGPQNITSLVATLSEGFNKINPTTTSSGPIVTPQTTPIDETDSPKVAAESESAVPSSNKTTEKPVDDIEKSTKDKEEQIKRYREKMQQRRQQRDEEEKEKDKERESRRRREGQEYGHWKKDQEERERQHWLNERKKQKLEDQRAKQEILAKLEQDKQERLALKKQKSSEDSARSQVKSPPAGATVVPSVLSAVHDGSSRIQVKFPDGHTTVLNLSSNDTIFVLRTQIAEYMEIDDLKMLSITCVYPRKELGTDVDDTTLSDQGLAPSGVVLVHNKLKRSSTFGSNEGGVINSVWNALMGLFRFILMILVSVKNGLLGLFQGGNTPSPSSQDRVNTAYQNSSNRQPSRSSDGPRFRKFNQDDFKDDDDEKRKNTYNGNSTQQL